jgi:chromosomal replication initiator protein
MSHNDLTTVWSNILDTLKSEMKAQDLVFFDHLMPSRVTETAAFFTTPNPLVKDMIEKRFYDRISELLEEYFQTPLTLNIEILDDSAPYQHQNSEDRSLPKEISDSLSINQVLPQIQPKKQSSSNSDDSKLIKLFTFETFIPDASTEYAFALAQAVSRNPGKNDINPLFIYGNVGVGKTHLMHAIGNYASKNSENKIVCITAEVFLNDFVEATRLKGSAMKVFRNKYRNTDILLIDDIHTLKMNMPGTQEELFNTINSLTGAHKQIVFTCDRPAYELKELQERISSRLAQGVQANLQVPSFETRIAILENRLDIIKRQKNIFLSKEVIHLISSKISTNVRDLIGALNNITNYAELIRKDVTVEIAQELLKDHLTQAKPTDIPVEIIIKSTADRFGVTVKDIKGHAQKHSIVKVRNIAMYLTRELAGLSLAETGEHFGGKHHTAVLYAEKKVKDLIKLNPAEEIIIQELTKIIKENAVK